MPRVSELVRVRPEVTDGDLQGIVSLHNLLSDEDMFEKDAQRVFAATFPTEALRRLLHRLRLALSDRDTDRKGNYVISGGYGSGKSHLLLCLYHILKNPQVSSPWLREHGIEFERPPDAVTILLPMNQLTMPDGSAVEYLWEPIFDALGYSEYKHTSGDFPKETHLKDAVAGRRVFLIVDEIERWFLPMRDKYQQHANSVFVQNLTEFCQDPDNGMVAFITLLMLGSELQGIIDRVKPFPEDMTQTPDRQQVVLHRLIESVDPVGAAEVVDAYVGTYRQVESSIDVGDLSSYRDEMMRCYPFHPATIRTVFDRYSGVAKQEEHSYQNSRGALYLLADILREAIPGSAEGQLVDADLIRTADVSLDCRMLSDDLRTLDTGLLDIGISNLRASAAVPQAASVLSVVLLHSLADPVEKRKVGATFADVLLGALRPESSPAGGVSVNQIQTTLRLLEDTALNLHLEEDPARWVLRSEVNVQGKINRRARSDAMIQEAPQEVIRAMHAALGSSIVVFPAEDVPDARDITVVYSVRHLEGAQITQELYFGKSNPNGLVVVIPRSPGSLMDDPDIRWFAQTTLAARAVEREMRASGQVVPKLVTDKASGAQLVDAIPSRYGRWLAPIVHSETGDLGFRPYDVTPATVLAAVEDRYDASRYESAVLDAISAAGDTPPTIQEIRDAFYRQRSYPKPIANGRASFAPIDGAVQKLVHKGELKVIKGGDAHAVCGQDPGDFAAFAKVWRVAIATDEDKPKFDIRQSVLELAKLRDAKGATVQEIRTHCAKLAAAFPGEPPDDRAVDLALADLVLGRVLEAPALHDLAPPLASGAVVRAPAKDPAPDTWQDLHLGGASVAQARTQIIKDVAKTDKLSDVTIRLIQQAQGGEVGKLGSLLGVSTSGADADTRLRVAWDLSGLPITSRDELVTALDGLPTQGVIDVAVQLKRQGTPGGADAQ